MSIRVLIADDNSVVRRLIQQRLQQRSDIEICAQTSNGRESVAAATALKPDLLILDVRMPDMNGIEVAAVLKPVLPHAKTILFTMYDEFVGPSVASAAGVHYILSKPDGISQLLAAVEELLGPGENSTTAVSPEKHETARASNAQAAGSTQC